MPNGEKSVPTLSFEFASTNILSFVIAVSALYYLSYGVLDLSENLKILFTQFSAGMVLGGILGVIWLIVTYYIRRETSFYPLTLAFLLAAYASAESFGGSGPFASLVYGILIGNYERFGRILGFKFDISEISPIRDILIRFHSEITFLIRSFLFVMLGLSFTFTNIFEPLFSLLWCLPSLLLSSLWF